MALNKREFDEAGLGGAVKRRVKRTKPLGVREVNTVNRCAEVLGELYGRYVDKHTALLEAYDMADGLVSPAVMEEQIKGCELALERIESEIRSSVANIFGAFAGMTQSEVIRMLRRRSYAEAEARLKDMTQGKAKKSRVKGVAA